MCIRDRRADAVDIHAHALLLADQPRSSTFAARFLCPAAGSGALLEERPLLPSLRGAERQGAADHLLGRLPQD
eukprot:5989691-Prymnesium_polylepis.1